MTQTVRPVRGVEMPRSVQAVRRATPRPAQLALKTAVRRFGAATGGLRPLPDYLIIGAKKGGTSSLTNWLIQHPGHLRMFPSYQPLKSAHFFDIAFHEGVDWYRGHFPTARARLRHPGAVVGEASPYYMFHPAAAGRARSVVPDAKIIAVLRDPVSRAYSNYHDRVAAGTETLPTFEAAIDAEPGRLAGVDEERLRNDPCYYSLAHDQFTYLARGRYLEHLSSWLDTYPAEQVLVLRAEDMYADPAAEFRRVERFLGLRHHDGVDLRTYNERSKPPMDPRTRARLAEYYRPHNEALAERLGRDLGWD
ncbi:sulfotransferase domain-containing protein [Nocardioides sp. CFH 31398]|uniref:sulfotransferase domain-containing protein n=1 Tax=Nocardioides sp. CFH 31398 TaxID=2919579 RepID=UPI001F065D96|nr:sulfotransferase domain-containing protein [Nocardioides sp. CFH 31398]MCH1867533.1 sulfotransferase domain-containing protein [Nocardioides sp. CFH 31398]